MNETQKPTRPRQNSQQFRRLGIPVAALLAFSSAASAQHWTPLPTFPGSGAGTALLEPDGNVMVQEITGPGGTGTGNWYQLAPSNTGDYQAGVWSMLPSTSGFGYGPQFFGSAVLTNGQMVFEGGEYNFGSNDDTTMGFDFRPIVLTWSSIPPPSGWTKIGDAPTVVLPNGTFMMGSCCSKQEALLDLSALTWTTTGSGKADSNSEEGWTLLPNGKVLTVDTQNGTESELFNPSTGTWSLAGNLPVPLTNNCGMAIVPEMGPAVLRPDGTVFAVGANSNTAIYNSSTGVWTKGPTFPSEPSGPIGVADGPAALLPDGNVLVMASNIAPCFQSPAYFFEFNGTSLTAAPSPPNAANEASYSGRMLELPNGHILLADGTKNLYAYVPKGSAESSWAPHITSFPATISEGVYYTIEGTQLNGLSQGAAYGDDAQMATNFQLLRIMSGGLTYYLPTKNYSTMGVATGSKVVSFEFSLPFFVEPGAATLEVVTNGIASNAVTVTVN